MTLVKARRVFSAPPYPPVPPNYPPFPEVLDDAVQKHRPRSNSPSPGAAEHKPLGLPSDLALSACSARRCRSGGDPRLTLSFARIAHCHLDRIDIGLN